MKQFNLLLQIVAAILAIIISLLALRSALNGEDIFQVFSARQPEQSTTDSNSHESEYRRVGSVTERTDTPCERGRVETRDGERIFVCTGSEQRPTGRECRTNRRTGERECRQIETQHSICGDRETHVIVQIRGVPIEERDAINENIVTRVRRGELPRESDNYFIQGAEARWHTECR